MRASVGFIYTYVSDHDGYMPTLFHFTNQIRRYTKLLRYYKSRPGFAEQEKWISNTLTMLGNFDDGLKKHIGKHVEETQNKK